jgi:hypothetical protein
MLKKNIKVVLMGRIESYNTAQESIDEIQAHDNRTESASSTERSTQRKRTMAGLKGIWGIDTRWL